MAPLVWLITGTSSGLGRGLTLEVLKRGDKVIATSRPSSLSKLDDLKAQGADAIALDVTDSLDNLKKAAEVAVGIHGRIDVLVNNAGYILVGALEENTPEETFEQFNTNVFGAINVSRAFLPYMREKKTGTVVFLGSIAGWAPIPNSGMYVATKYAIRGISETLNAEIQSLGLRSVCFEPGYFRTDFLSGGHRTPYVPKIDDYKEMAAQADAALTKYDHQQPGDPKKGVAVMADVIRGEGLAAGKAFPPVLHLGSDCFEVVVGRSKESIERAEEWKDVIFSTDF